MAIFQGWFRKTAWRLALVSLCAGLSLLGLPYQARGGAVLDWAARYNGPGEDRDEARAIAVDGQGYVFVTGLSTGVGTGLDYATLKYNPSGAPIWERRYNGPDNLRDEARVLALDGQGNVYVSGVSGATNKGADLLTIKYSSSGEELWTVRFNGTGNGDDVPMALALDGLGNVYVTGYTWGSGTSYDYVTIKYNSLGAQQWATTYHGAYGNDYAYALAVDGQGNVYVTGRSRGAGEGFNIDDFATVKYNSSGVEQWVRRYNGPGDGYDAGRAIAVDGQGNIYVTGHSENEVPNDQDYTTIKYNVNGDVLWSKRYDGPANGTDFPEALVLGPQGNVHVTGTSQVQGLPGEFGYDDFATVTYDSDGNELWVAHYNGPASRNDWAKAIAVDDKGNVYVTGESLGDYSGSQTDYATIKYTPAGQHVWTARFNSPQSLGDYPQALAVDSQGNIYVTGYTERTSTAYDYDYLTIKYRQSAYVPLDLLLLD